MYTIESIDGKLQDKERELSGAYLTQHGIQLSLNGNFDSTAVIFERVQ